MCPFHSVFPGNPYVLKSALSPRNLNKFLRYEILQYVQKIIIASHLGFTRRHQKFEILPFSFSAKDFPAKQNLYICNIYKVTLRINLLDTLFKPCLPPLQD